MIWRLGKNTKQMAGVGFSIAVGKVLSGSWCTLVHIAVLEQSPNLESNWVKLLLAYTGVNWIYFSKNPCSSTGASLLCKWCENQALFHQTLQRDNLWFGLFSCCCNVWAWDQWCLGISASCTTLRGEKRAWLGFVFLLKSGNEWAFLTDSGMVQVEDSSEPRVVQNARQCFSTPLRRPWKPRFLLFT